MTNPLINECIKKLTLLKSDLNDLNENSHRADGINSANASIKESIDARISLLVDIYSDDNQEPVHPDSSYAAYCLEFVDSLEEVFKDLIEELEENEFNKAYKQQIDLFLMLLQPIQGWLRAVK